MARVKSKCIMGCSGLKRSYREKGLLSLVIQSQRDLNHQRQPQHLESMFSAALGFPKGKRVTDHYSILAQEAVGFSQGLLPP